MLHKVLPKDLDWFSRFYIGEVILSNLIKCAKELPDKMSDNGLEEIIIVWNRKSRRIATHIDWRSNYAFTTSVVCI